MSRPEPNGRRLSLGLSGLAGVLALVILDQLGPVPEGPAPEAPTPARPAAQRIVREITTAPPLEVLSATRSRPLFSAARRPPEPESAAPDAAPRPAPLTYDLVGVTLFDGRGIALVRDRAADRLLRVAPGQRLGPWRVTGIDPNSLRLRGAGITRELRLKDARSGVARADRRPAAKTAPEAPAESDAPEAAAAAVKK